MKFAAVSIGLIACSAVATASSEPGEKFEYQMVHSEKSSSSGGSSGSSSGRDAMVSRLVALRDGGQELEFDLPAGADARSRAAQWQFPARIFVPATGPKQLLNQTELETRRDRFLKNAGWTAEVCGRWIFTWNAFKIECDPQSAIAIVDQFVIQPPAVGDGAAFSMQGGLGTAPMRCQPAGEGSSCSVTLPIDPAAIRSQRAEAAVVVGEITGKPVSLAAATSRLRSTEVAGTIRIDFEVDSKGVVIRRQTTAEMTIQEPGGAKETSTTTETIVRRQI